MTQENKELLVKDLCARLPWCIKVQYDNKIYSIDYVSAEYEEVKLNIPDNYTVGISDIKPYLRPMSSMTEEEKKYISDKCGFSISSPIGNECVLIMPVLAADWLIDFYNEHHIDYRGLIGKGLALEAPIDIYI